MRLKRDGTLAEIRFLLSPKRTSPFKSAGASVHSTAGSRGMRIGVSNAGYTRFRGSVRVLATHSIRQFPLHFTPRNGRVHLNRQGRQFIRLLAAEVCASALVMLDTPGSEVVWEYWLPTPFASFPFTSPPVRHCVPSGFKRTLPS